MGEPSASGDKPKGKLPDWTANTLLVLGSVGLFLLCLEVVCRFLPATELQMNDPYRYLLTIGVRAHHCPYFTYMEKVPLKYDHQGYYAPTDGIVVFHSNQLGARWTEPADQELGDANILVLGDSFTYGHGLYYEDTFSFMLQEKLNGSGRSAAVLNLAERGADSVRTLEIYRRFKDEVPHRAVFYGLHINDVMEFPTNYVINNPLAIPWLVQSSRAAAFIAKRFHNLLLRNRRIEALNDPSMFEKEYFIKNFAAIRSLHEKAGQKGARLYVLVLPILNELKKDAFRPLYRGIIERLEKSGIACVDLTESVKGMSDKSLWVLPFDQHPNKRANAVFAGQLFERFKEADFLDAP